MYLAISFLAVFSLAQSALAQGAPLAPPSLQTVPSTYILGPDDQVSLQVFEAEEASGKPYRIDESGMIRVPMIGAVKAGGLTIRELENSLSAKFAAFIKQPQVTVSVTEARSQPVSVVGAVMTPGVHQLQGHKSLLEMLSLAGGLRMDAGYRMKITRRSEWGAIPLPGAVASGDGQYSVAEVELKKLLDASRPEDNIAVMPQDVLTVPVAELIYVVGDVKKSGGFVMGERKQISVLQALALSEGTNATARASDARILRPVAGSTERTEIVVDLKKILEGHANDVFMQSNDILFVPVSGAKRAGYRAIESLLTVGSGIAIYRP
jgi:polysaccharide export outer membrane protein